MTTELMERAAGTLAHSITNKVLSRMPAFIESGPASLELRFQITVEDGVLRHHLPSGMPVQIGDKLVVGADYGIVLRDEGRALVAIPIGPGYDLVALGVIGGFHYAPGGNASARAGGDETPAINPHSMWDLAYRPACPDPRGMTCVAMPNGTRFWCDIYLLNDKPFAEGTSRFGLPIADGDTRPAGRDGKTVTKLDHATAAAIYEAHGKGLLSIEEFWAAAVGVTEKTSADDEPEVTGLDAPRTSRFGVMQATGNMDVWGHDGDEGEYRRPAVLGGYWAGGGWAGSRYAYVTSWPDDSIHWVSARGRSDHLQLG